MLPFVSGAGGSVWPAMHGRRGVVCARRLYVTVVCVCRDGFFDRAGACAGGGLVWRRCSAAWWRLRPAIGCRNGSWPCGDIHCILFFLVLINFHPCLCLILFPGMGVVEMAAYIGQSEGGLR